MDRYRGLKYNERKAAGRPERFGPERPGGRKDEREYYERKSIGTASEI